MSPLRSNNHALINEHEFSIEITGCPYLTIKATCVIELQSVWNLSNLLHILPVHIILEEFSACSPRLVAITCIVNVT